MKFIFLIFFCHKLVFAFYHCFSLKYKLIKELGPVFEHSSLSDWKLLGNTTYTKDKISLTHSLTYELSSIWWNKPNIYKNWEIRLKYSCYFDGLIIADAIALWYTRILPESPGQLYGGLNETFTGLLISIDAFEKREYSDKVLFRTTKQSALNVVNNETPRKFDWASEGLDISSGRCIVQNRYENRSDTIATLIVRYVSNTLEVFHTNATSFSMLLCTEIPNINLTTNNFFGISGKTGKYQASYELHSFEFYSITESTELDLQQFSSEAFSNYDMISYTELIILCILCCLMLLLIALQVFGGITLKSIFKKINSEQKPVNQKEKKRPVITSEILKSKQLKSKERESVDNEYDHLEFP